MAVEIFHGVGDQAILSERHHDVVRAENEVGQKAAVDHMVAAPLLQRAHGAPALCDKHIVLALIVGEIAAELLDIEASLLRGEVSGDQVLEPGLARDQDNLALIVCGHWAPPKPSAFP
jgi:hypothetical protein